MLASLKRNQPATQPLSRLDHRRFAEVRQWQETDVHMDPGNTTAARTRKHAPETGMSRLERKRLYTSRAPASTCRDPGEPQHQGLRERGVGSLPISYQD